MALRSLLAATGLLLAAPAWGQQVLDYTEDFDRYSTNDFSGTDGWRSGYDDDEWTTADVSGMVWAKSSDSGGTWGSDGAADNHLVQTGRTWGDHTFTATLRSWGNGVGVVFHFRDEENFYLLVLSDGGNAPSAADGAASTWSGIRLYAVVGGVGTQLAGATTPTYDASEDHRVEIRTSGDEIRVWFDEDRDGLFTGDQVFNVTDATHATGAVGVYCYDSGGIGGSFPFYHYNCGFDDVEVRIPDSDEDGIPDRDDVCAGHDDTRDDDDDGVPDGCDLCEGFDDSRDADNDGVPNGCDQCLGDDATGDADGDDVCDDQDECTGDDDSGDSDNDGACDDTDACPDDPLDDSDGDGHCDSDDNCPGASNADQADLDEDDEGDVCDPDADGDGHDAGGGDCDDRDPDVNPDAEEVCNGVDDDCANGIDDGVLLDFFLDGDDDGWGGTLQTACSAPPDHVARGGDCDDADPSQHPEAGEVCNGEDDDCNGLADDGADGVEHWPDADGDGFGDDTVDPVLSCEAPAGHVDRGEDCDDQAATVNPDAQEVCNGVDDDCDGLADGPDAGGALPFHADLDGDGFGDPLSEVLACEAPDDHVADDTDCDDDDRLVHPGAFEQCNGVDDDCDPLTDDSGTDTEWYLDLDHDGWGSGDPELDCAAPGEDYSLGEGDCDDEDAEVNPGAQEVCNGVDDDCDGGVDVAPVDGVEWLEDLDLDGFGGATVTGCEAPDGAPEEGGDCDDQDPAAYPGAPEIPDDGVDQDCDGGDLAGTSSRTWTGSSDVVGLGAGCSCGTGGPGPSWLLLAVLPFLRRREPRTRA